MTPAHLHARDLSRRYPGGGMDGLDLEVEPGTVVGIAGPNGAGKSTALGLLAARVRPDRGRLDIGGIDAVAAGRRARARIGYLAHRPPLYEDMRVADFLDHAAHLYGVARPQRARAVALAMERASISDVAPRRIRNLSAGYRRRTGLAQALVHDPSVLILDEPTTGLDAESTTAFVARLNALTADRVVIMASHLFSELDRLCHRIAIIQGGRVAADRPLAPDAAAGNALIVRLRDREGGSPATEELGLASVERLGDGAFRIEGADDAARRRLMATILERGWSLDEWSRASNGSEQLYRAVVESLAC